MSSASPHRHTQIILIFTIFSSLLLSPVLSATPSDFDGTNNDNNVIEIGTADDLILFSNSVNSGTNYSNKTVLLTADIDFDDNLSKYFYPIGNSTNLWFSGTFDGQGYIINNLKITKGSSYVFGVFGHSKGGTFKNVVLGPSCEIACQVNNVAHVSGIVGTCQTTACSISNSVNVASVSFNGVNTGPPLHIGGIAGYFQGDIKNCANYGTITVSYEASGNNIYVGGIVGYSSQGTITNCINYGEIRYTGSTTRDLRIGGILGYFHSNSNLETIITNCVNMGKVTASDKASNSYVGGIVGHYGDYGAISNCYWDGTICYNYTGYDGGSSIVSNVSSFDSATLQLSESVTAGDYTGNSLIAALNAFAVTSTTLHSLWASNGNKKDISFTINNRTSPLLITAKSVILLPSLLNESNVLSTEWFSDKCFTTPFNEPAIPTRTTRLYGLWDGFVPEEGCDSSSSSSSLSSSSSSSSFSSSSSLILSEYVEITFDKKDLTREEATEIIKEIAGNDNFEVVEFEVDENGELKVIVKFNDVEEAQNFIKNIKETSNSNHIITKATFIFEPIKSNSPQLLNAYFIYHLIYF